MPSIHRTPPSLLACAARTVSCIPIENLENVRVPYVVGMMIEIFRECRSLEGAAFINAILPASYFCASHSVDSPDSGEALIVALSRHHFDIAHLIYRSFVFTDAIKSKVLECCVENDELCILKHMLSDAAASDTLSLAHNEIKSMIPKAAQNDSRRILSFLIDYCTGHDGDDVVRECQQCMMLACSLGHESVVKLLLSGHYDIHYNDDAALRLAASTGNHSIVQLLLTAGADVHVRRDEALINAITYGSKSVVKLLCDAGADVHVDNERPLTAAVECRKPHIVKLLVKCGANKSIAASILKHKAATI